MSCRFSRKKFLLPNFFFVETLPKKPQSDFTDQTEMHIYCVFVKKQINTDHDNFANNKLKKNFDFHEYNFRTMLSQSKQKNITDILVAFQFLGAHQMNLVPKLYFFYLQCRIVVGALQKEKLNMAVWSKQKSCV